MPFKKATATLIALLAMTGTNLAAPMASPEGVWELEFRDSRFDVSICGEQDLCGELVWLSESASTPEKTKYLNTLMIDHAQRRGDRTWKGELSLFGDVVDGNITQVSDDVIDLKGCKFGLLCRTYKLYRVTETE